MIKALWRNEWKIFINTIKSQSLKNYIIYGIVTLVIGVFMTFASVWVWNNGPSIPNEDMSSLFTYGCLAIIGLIILLGIPQVFKSLYAGEDLGLLFTLPISTKSIFWIKYIKNLLGVPLFIFLFIIIPVIVFGIASGAHMLFYPVMLMVLITVFMIGLSLAYLFNLILVQIVPKARANEFMTVMSLLSGIFVYLLFMTMNIFNDDSSSVDHISSSLPVLPRWFPLTWSSDAIVYALSGSSRFLIPFALFTLLAILIIAITFSFVEKGFRVGWLKLNEGSHKKKKKVKENKKITVHHPIVAVGLKEWYVLKRDLREWIVFMPVGIFIIFPVITFFTSGASLSDVREFNTISWPIAQAGLLFLFALLNGNIAAYSIGREGKSVSILRALPLTGEQIVYGKFWISWLIPFLLFTVLEVIVGIILNWTLLQLIGGIIVKAIITTGISGIGLWLGTIGAKYNPANPQARLHVAVSFILIIISYVYLFLSLLPYTFLLIPEEAAPFMIEISGDTSGFFGRIISLFAVFLIWKGSHPILVILLLGLVLLVISFLITWFFLHLAARRVDKGIDIDMVNESNQKPLFKGRGGSLY